MPMLGPSATLANLDFVLFPDKLLLANASCWDDRGHAARIRLRNSCS
jgi:hypothetical protein